MLKKGKNSPSNILWRVAYALRIFAWTDHFVDRVERVSNVVQALNVPCLGHHPHRHRCWFLILFAHHHRKCRWIFSMAV